MSRLEPSPSTVGRWATDVDALRPSVPGFVLPMSIAPHLSLWRLIAEGSSLVYEGFDRRMAARVAVKVLAVRDDANAHARLLREAALYANLDHPSVPRLYDVATLNDGTPYVVMEFVAGHTLAELLQQGPLAPSLACDVANQVLSSLAALHRAGIVHRDIKPTNIILEPGDEGRRCARLVDLGVAKASAFNMAPDKLTQPGALLGTPQYMAPEQFAGAEADPRADLYAVGLVLVEMLTGACPHAARSFADLVAARMRDELDEDALARAGVGPGLTRFLRTALARDPQARFGSAEDMQCELHAARADESCLWMQRSPRRPSAEPVAAVGPVATLPPAALSVPQTPVESAVWGVLPDPPAYDSARRPPARSGMRALLLGFGLTFGVGGLLVFRAQPRDTAEAAAPVESGGLGEDSALRQAPATPLAPASAVGLGDPAAPAARIHGEPPLSPASLDPVPALGTTLPGSESTAGPTSPPVAQRPIAQPVRRRAERVRRPQPVEADEFERPSIEKRAEPSALPENPY